MFKGTQVQGELQFWSAPGMTTAIPLVAYDATGEAEPAEYKGVWQGIDNWGFEFLFILPYIQCPIDYGEAGSNAGYSDDLTDAGKVPDSSSHSNLIGLNKMKFRGVDGAGNTGTTTVKVHLVAYIA